MRVLVTGGTGTLGRALVPLLVEAGHDTTVMSRRPGPGDAVADLVTGDGLAAAVAGADTVVHLASSPYRRTMAEVEIGGTGRLLAAAAGAGVGHLIYVSIVAVA
ncbi:SDR family oxidoreductase [Rhizomonospora bruguierae]|uniref:SDR family oxidoreductase n=1 Tax=Rhizomonospora bruguierae TaxID=1581705 RepID=UPI001BCC7C27|nr:NAD-dependent epimerase/dehydratase family protein [Micromonospora sp. NBRC 107566]